MVQSGPRLARSEGFTLIEMVVVVAVVAVLSTIAVGNYSKVKVHAQAAVIAHDLELLEDAIIQTAIMEDLGPGDAPINLEELRSLLKGNAHLTDLRLPAGVSVFYNGTTDRKSTVIRLMADDRHRSLLQILGTMRPNTSYVVGGMDLEVIDFTDLKVITPAR